MGPVKAPVCHNCGAYAMHGLRFPGPLSEQKAKGYVWSCRRQECKDAAEKKRDDAIAKSR